MSMSSPNSPVPTAVPVTLPASNEIDTVYKPADSIYSSPKASSLLALGRAPNSLNRLMAGHGLKSARSAFVMEMASRQEKKHEVSFESYGYGYGQDEEEKSSSNIPQNELPQAKRRRFQRRNSKTPAMLMKMNSPLLLHLDFLEDKKEFYGKTGVGAGLGAGVGASTTNETTATSTSASALPSMPTTASTSTSTETAQASRKPDSWDGGLEIAEELVKHLQKRRESSNM